MDDKLLPDSIVPEVQHLRSCCNNVKNIEVANHSLAYRYSFIYSHRRKAAMFIEHATRHDHRRTTRASASTTRTARKNKHALGQLHQREQPPRSHPQTTLSSDNTLTRSPTLLFLSNHSARIFSTSAPAAADRRDLSASGRLRETPVVAVVVGRSGAGERTGGFGRPRKAVRRGRVNDRRMGVRRERREQPAARPRTSRNRVHMVQVRVVISWVR